MIRIHPKNWPPESWRTANTNKSLGTEQKIAHTESTLSAQKSRKYYSKLSETIFFILLHNYCNYWGVEGEKSNSQVQGSNTPKREKNRKKEITLTFLKNINHFRKMPLYGNYNVIHDNYSIHFCLILPNNFTIKNFSVPGSVIILNFIMYRNIKISLTSFYFHKKLLKRGNYRIKKNITFLTWE